MAMAKRFKLKFTLPSFQICRSKKLSNFPGNPVPSIYRLSPVNPKACDIGYPILPTPLPSTPEDRFVIQCDCKLSPKIISMADGCRSRACKHRVHSHHPADFADSAGSRKIHCRTVFAERNDDKGKKVKARSISSGRTNSSGKKDNIDYNNDGKGEECEALMSCITSFSDEFSDKIDHSLETARPEPDREIGRHRRRISDIKKVRRLRFQTSRNQTELEIGETKKKMISTETGCSVTYKRPMRGCTVEGKVKESFAVVKKSKDPYDDFKRSMLEMITEMEMFEAKDLEQLLQCFLTLNSRRYHGVIVQAFMEIWKELFYEFHVDPKSSKNLENEE
ncbi:hypothetical protein L6164_024750 [Bauhinia variegata]|uniref:Uncharacterized protein n=1 Tax=Bauhinia variegata TaxID=167791 RepID=A0ACB9LYH3_BAUVA|nr:hypothetical protein L6164_024750 [Bauhinia variegata]